MPEHIFEDNRWRVCAIAFVSCLGFGFCACDANPSADTQGPAATSQAPAPAPPVELTAAVVRGAAKVQSAREVAEVEARRRRGKKIGATVDPTTLMQPIGEDHPDRTRRLLERLQGKSP